MKKKILLIIPVAVILFLFIACENQEFMDVESKSAEEPMQSVAEVAAHKDYFALWSIDPFVAKYHTELSIYNYS